MKRTLFIYFILLSTLTVFAQEGESVFNFLRIPTSAKASALGGTNISLIEQGIPNDISLIFQNPAFLGPEMDLNVNANYMFYINDIGVGSFAFGKALGDKSAWALGINYANYGSMTETSEYDLKLGDLAAKDICVNALFSRDLTDKIRGGVNAKFVYSAYDSYTAIGLGVDLGLSYYNRDNDFSIGLTGKNLGRQVKAYNEINESMPWDIQLGFTKRLSHAPIRFSLTTVHLNQWTFYDKTGKEDQFMTTLLKHFIFGVELIPSENFWIGLGYNVKTGMDMSLNTGNKMGGFSAGAGLQVKAFNIGVSVGRYHPSATSFLVSLTTSLSEFKL